MRLVVCEALQARLVQDVLLEPEERMAFIAGILRGLLIPYGHVHSLVHHRLLEAFHGGLVEIAAALLLHAHAALVNYCAGAGPGLLLAQGLWAELAEVTQRFLNLLQAFQL